MPAKRRYNVKGTKDFLVLALIFFFLCLWAIKDAWFPSDKVLKKHPMKIDVAFATAGTVDNVMVKEGDKIGEKMLLATLRRDRLAVEFDEAKEVYTEARDKFNMLNQAAKNAYNNGATDASIEGLQERAEEAKAIMNETLQTVNELRVQMDSSELQAPDKGEILEVRIAEHQLVEAGETALVIDPKDHFYAFNKSLAVFSFFAFWVFLAIHILAR